MTAALHRVPCCKGDQRSEGEAVDLGQLIKRVALAALAVGVALVLLKVAGAEAGGSSARIVPRLAGIGSLLVFFSPYVGGSRAIRYRRVNPEVPWMVWRILGVAVWIVAGICLLALD